MVLATVSTAFSFSSTELLNYVESRDEIPNFKVPGSEQKRLKKAENCGAYLAKAELTPYILEDCPKWAAPVIPAILPSKDEANKYAHNYFDKLNDKEKKNSDIALRQAIFLLASGEKTEQALSGLAPFASDPLCIQLESLEYQPKEKIDIQTAETVFKSKLPEGWYQTQVLQRLYEKCGEKAEIEAYKSTLKTTAADRLAKSFATLSVVAGYCLLGLITFCNYIIIYGKKPYAQDNNAFAECGLRAVYAAALTTFYIQFAIGFFIGCFLPLVKFLAPALLPQATVISTSLVGFLGNLTALLSMHFILAKPLGLGLKQALTRPAQLSLSRSLIWATGAVCLFQFFSFAYSSILYAIFHTVSSSNNPIIDQVHQALNLKSVLPIILIYVLTALTTPIVEEVFFRGICYSIFKKRYGVLGGAIISGAIFGVAHLDPNSFVVLTLLGAGLAILYERTGRLSACIFAHFLWNTWFILAQFLLK